GSEDKTLKLWRVGEGTAAPFRLCRVAATEQILSAQTAFQRALQRAEQALDRDNAVDAARSLREARAQPGHARQREAIRIGGELYLGVPGNRFRGGWECTTAFPDSGVETLNLSRDGKYAISGSYREKGQVILWEARSGRQLRTFLGHRDRVRCVCFSTD